MAKQDSPELQFDDVLKSLQKLKISHVDRYVIWYQSHKKWNRRLHIFSTTTVILLGVTMPVLVMAKFGDGYILTAALGLSALSSLSTGFQWGARWRQQTYAQLELEDACADWEFSLVSIKQRRSASEAVDTMKQLLSRTRIATKSESADFFRSVDNASQTSLQLGSRSGRDPNAVDDSS